jgi:hypothetical protein
MSKIGDQNWDDYITSREGTIFGDIARKGDKAIKGEPYLPHRTAKKRKNPVLDNPGQLVSTDSVQPNNPRNNFLPGVDDWFMQHLSQKARRRIILVLSILGFFSGIGAAPSLGLTVWAGAALGAVAGLIAFKLFIIIVKVTIVLLTLAAIVAFFYALFEILYT